METERERKKEEMRFRVLRTDSEKERRIGDLTPSGWFSKTEMREKGAESRQVASWDSLRKKRGEKTYRSELEI